MSAIPKLARIVLPIYWLTILVLTHIPQSKLPLKQVSDKLAHFVVFTVLTALLWLALPAPKGSLVYKVLVVLAVVLIYGALDELTQPWFNRFCSLDDWFADAIGALIGVTAMLLLWRSGPTNLGGDRAVG
jgi:VanZ family protein